MLLRRQRTNHLLRLSILTVHHSQFTMYHLLLNLKNDSFIIPALNRDVLRIEKHVNTWQCTWLLSILSVHVALSILALSLD